MAAQLRDGINPSASLLGLQDEVDGVGQLPVGFRRTHAGKVADLVTNVADLHVIHAAGPARVIDE